MSESVLDSGSLYLFTYFRLPRCRYSRIKMASATSINRSRCQAVHAVAIEAYEVRHLQEWPHIISENVLMNI
ncbi:hypothetical protein BC629DRAFT_1520910 [Irpex lacteus]|nr:hypothetical protein BC629DRAFT_1520910 [Irpex lacteus]